MNAYVAVTDNDWFRFLAEQDGVDEVNFWYPRPWGFRALITDLYDRTCAITRERALPALEVAHIKPYSDTPEHEIRNGLLLRSDVHRLFDMGYITVTCWSEPVDEGGLLRWGYVHAVSWGVGVGVGEAGGPAGSEAAEVA